MSLDFTFHIVDTKAHVENQGLVSYIMDIIVNC